MQDVKNLIEITPVDGISRQKFLKLPGAPVLSAD